MTDNNLGHRATLVLAVAAAFAACVQPTTAANPPAFDGGRAMEHLRAVVGFGPRPPGSAAAEETRRYIKAQMAAIGVQVAEQAFEAKTPIGPVKMVNVRATIPGARPERIILAGHYDTKLFRQFRFVGANDAGSSTAFLIEMARVLTSRKNPFTIELLFIDGEEAFIDWYLADDHTYGSRHYVAEARRSGDLARIKAMILVDMIGDRDLVIKRETDVDGLAHRRNLGGRDVARLRLHLRPGVVRRRGRPRPVPQRRRAGGGHHRSRVPAVAHRRGHPRQGERAEHGSGWTRPDGRAAEDRETAYWVRPAERPARCRAAAQAARMPAAPTAPPDRVAVRAAWATAGSITSRIVTDGPRPCWLRA